MYTRAVESQQARSNKFSMRTALGRGSLGPAQNRAGNGRRAATSRNESRGQFFFALPENGWMIAKFSIGTVGTWMRGVPITLIGSAGENVNGRWRTASRNSSRLVPYQE